MPSVRLSNESLRFLKQSKIQKASEGYKTFVSVVHDEEESDVESEEDEPAVVLTPRLKAHSRRIAENYADRANPNIKELQPIPVSNLSKRFSSGNLGTPSRILQLALEKKSANDSHDHEMTAEEPSTSSSDIENEAISLRNEVAVKQPARLESNKRVPARKKPAKAQEGVKAFSENEADFKAPLESRGKKIVEPTDRQAKPARARGKNTQQQIVDDNEDDAQDSAAPDDEFEPQTAKVSRRNPRQGQKNKENSRKPTTALMSPAELSAATVRLENDSTVGTTQDVSLRDNASNVTKNTPSVDCAIGSMAASVSGNKNSPVAGRGLRSSRNKKSPLKRAEYSEGNVPVPNVRRGRPKKAETSPTKRPARNKRGGKVPLTIPDEGVPEVMTQNEPNNDNAQSDETKPVVPEFSSDHEEDRTPSNSISRDSPILSKSNRLSAVLETKSASSDDSSVESLPPYRKRLSTVQSRSPSSSPDMFTPTPRKDETENGKQQGIKILPNAAKAAAHLPNEPTNSHPGATRTRRRASIGTMAKSSVASNAPPTPSSSGESTPMQLEAVGLVRKPTPQGVPKFRTPPRKLMTLPVATPLSSRSRAVQAEQAAELTLQDKEESSPIKRKQMINTPKSPPKRQRVESSSPEISKEPAKLETPKSTLKRQRVQLASPEKFPELSNSETPISTSKRQRVQKPSPHKLPEPVDINTEETLPIGLARADFMEGGNLGVKVISDSTNKEQPSSSRRAEQRSSELAIFKRPKNTPVVHPSFVETARFNPYLAPPEDPVRASLLLSNDEFRVTWLHILPKCSFYFRVYSPTVVLLISGIILISEGASQSGFVLNPKSRVAELNVGSLCQAINTGSTSAIFQITESLS